MLATCVAQASEECSFVYKFDFFFFHFSDIQIQLFQFYATRVLQQFLSRIIFFSTFEIPDTLIHKLIELFGTKGDDEYQIVTNDVNLFERNKIHPSLALRSIILGYILSLG